MNRVLSYTLTLPWQCGSCGLIIKAGEEHGVEQGCNAPSFTPNDQTYMTATSACVDSSSLRDRLAASTAALYDAAVREKKMTEALVYVREHDIRLWHLESCSSAGRIGNPCDCGLGKSGISKVCDAALAPLSPGEITAYQRVIDEAVAQRTRECVEFVLNFGRRKDENPTGASIMISAALRAKYPEALKE